MMYTWAPPYWPVKVGNYWAIVPRGTLICPSFAFEEKDVTVLMERYLQFSRQNPYVWLVHSHVTIHPPVIYATAMYIHVFLKIVAVSMIEEWPIKTKWWWSEENH